jgi:hypothetical protein
MSIIKNILEMIQGKVHFYLFVGGSPAIEIILHDKEIIADIKNPILALELGLHQLGGKKQFSSSILDKVKEAGYKVKVRYKIFEIEL